METLYGDAGLVCEVKDDGVYFSIAEPGHNFDHVTVAPAGEYAYNQAADYVEMLYPKPLTCSCRRMILIPNWVESLSWYDTNRHNYACYAQCPSCHDTIHNTWVEHQKETAMPSNIQPKPWSYQHIHPDSAGYAECWKVLREAKKDGVIVDWGSYSSDCESQFSTIWIKDNDQTLNDLTRFRDDGTKGDIGILREAADYVLGLKHKQWVEKQKPDPKMMTSDQMNYEILSRGYKLLETTHANHTTPTFGLFRASHGPTGLSLQNNETMPEFLRKCVEHIRGQKK